MKVKFNPKWDIHDIKSHLEANKKIEFPLKYGDSIIVTPGILNNQYNAFFTKGCDTVSLTLGGLTTILNKNGKFYG